MSSNKIGRKHTSKHQRLPNSCAHGDDTEILHRKD